MSDGISDGHRNDNNEDVDQDRDNYRAAVRAARDEALYALMLARRRGWRTDCLFDAVTALTGCLRNIDFENAEALTKRKESQ